MKARILASILLGSIALVFASAVCGQQAAPQAPAKKASGPLPGVIKAAAIVGQVTVARGADKPAAALKNGDTVAQGDVVTTAKGSAVVLVFANGSTVNVGAESRLSIDQFLLDPFDAATDLAAAKEEPTPSHTKLNLTYGEVIGNVKKLKDASTYVVQTPVGSAGIRGTTFQLVYRPSTTGQAFFTLSTATGTVIFQGTTGTPVPVAADQAVVVEVQINDVTGAVTVVQVQSTTISTEAKQVIETQVTQALEAVSTTTFTTTTTTSTSSGSDSSGQSSDSGTGTSSDTGTDAGTSSGTGTGTDTSTGTGTGTGSGTSIPQSTVNPTSGAGS